MDVLPWIRRFFTQDVPEILSLTANTLKNVQIPEAWDDPKILFFLPIFTAVSLILGSAFYVTLRSENNDGKDCNTCNEHLLPCVQRRRVATR